MPAFTFYVTPRAGDPQRPPVTLIASDQDEAAALYCEANHIHLFTPSCAVDELREYLECVGGSIRIDDN